MESFVAKGKKAITATVCICLAVLSLAGCGSSPFTIEGKWKNVGDFTFGQVQKGAVVVFDGKKCNVVSPADTYAFYKDGDDYKLECTTLLFSQTLTFIVEVEDNDHIKVYNGSHYLEMSRVS